MSEIQVIKDQFQNVMKYVVEHESYAEAWLSSHPYVYIAIGAVVGSTAWELIEHTFGIK